MRKLLSISAALLMAMPLAAQEAAEAEAPAAQPAPETRASTPNEITRNVHGDWQIRCRTGEVQQCYLFQLILGPNDSPIMEYNLIPARDETGGDVVLAATLLAPLNTILPRGILMQVDENDPEQYAYSWCSAVGCFSRFGLTKGDTDSYRSGSKITAAIFSTQNPQQSININLSLNGFGAAYDELLEIEAEQAAAN